MATRRRSSPPTNSDRGYATMKTVSIMALVAALFASSDAYADGAKVTTLMRQPLHDYPGKEAVLAAVEYAPGHDDAAHRHPGHVFVYVVEGAVEMRSEERRVGKECRSRWSPYH